MADIHRRWLAVEHDGNATCEHHSHDHSIEDPTLFATFAITALSVGVMISVLQKTVPRLRKVPFSLFVLISGMVLGLFEQQVYLTKLSFSLDNWRHLNAEVLLYVFLPPLLFTAAFNVEYYIFRRLLWQAVLLATVGVLISAGLTAFVAVYMFDYGWSWDDGMLFGAMFGATDPVAVVALLKDMGAPETLSVLIEGESLLNDGVGFVLFKVYLAQSTGQETYNIGTILLRVIEASVFGTVFGLLFAAAGLLALQRVWKDSVIAVGITVTCIWGTFLVCETVEVSGVIGVVSLGLALASLSDGYIQVNVFEDLKRFWLKVEYMANTLVFLYSGVVIIDTLVEVNSTYQVTGQDVGNLILLFIFVNLIRYFMIVVLYPFLTRLGYGMDPSRAIVLGYAGLRGAVGLIAALLVLEVCDCAEGESGTEEFPCLLFDTRNRMMFHMAGIVLLTLAVNGITAKYVVNYFAINKEGSAARHFFEKATLRLHDHIDDVAESLRRHPHYRNADWNIVWQHLPILSTEVLEERKRLGMLGRDSVLLRGQIEEMTKKRFVVVDNDVKSTQVVAEVDMETGIESTGEDSLLLEEARYRFLSLVKAQYRFQFQEGANKSWPAMQVLIEAASRCQDKADKPINEWEDSIEKYVEIPQWYARNCLNLTVERHAANSYDVASNFLRAHKAVVNQFKSFVHESSTEIVNIILRENTEMLADAEAFAAEIEREFPAIAQAVKTNITAQRLLKEMETHAHKMFERAEIDEKDLKTIEHELERSRVHLNKVHKHHTPNKGEILRNCPLLFEVETNVVDDVLEKTVSRTLEAGTTLLKTGSTLNSIMIIAKGKVRLTHESGVSLMKTAGDALGVLEFVARMDKIASHAVCETAVEVVDISNDQIEIAMGISEGFAINVFREAGLILFESLYPQFQFANFNLLKSILPHVRVIRGEIEGGVTAHDRAGSRLSKRMHRSVNRRSVTLGVSQDLGGGSNSSQVFFRGGLVIGLRGSISSNGQPIPMLTSYEPRQPLTLSPGSVLFHVNAEAINTMESFSAYEQYPKGFTSPRIKKRLAGTKGEPRRRHRRLDPGDEGFQSGGSGRSLVSVISEASLNA